MMSKTVQLIALNSRPLDLQLRDHFGTDNGYNYEWKWAGDRLINDAIGAVALLHESDAMPDQTEKINQLERLTESFRRAKPNSVITSVIYREHTLGLLTKKGFETIILQILHASVLRGSTFSRLQGWEYLLDLEGLRLATSDDFTDYRVSPVGHPIGLPPIVCAHRPVSSGLFN